MPAEPAAAPAGSPPRVVVVSPRLPGGALHHPAWQLLSSGPVATESAASPHLPFLREAGVALQVHEPLPAADRARWLRRHPAVWFDAAPELLAALGPDAVVVHGNTDPPGARLLDVVAVMDRLRSPGGCPWDAAQTHVSLMPYLLEEAYEAYQALEEGSSPDLREELGDVLLQVVFHARLASETGWGIDEVAGDLVDKLVRRHPHVFADGSADDLEGSWEALKAAEKGRTSVTDGVPLGQPALSLAAKLQRRAQRLGAPVDVPDGAGPGGQLWDLVARCREQGVDPEVALRTTARAYRDALAAAERHVREDGGDPAHLTPARWAALLC